MVKLSALICSSNIKGQLFINGFVVGVCSKESPISIPYNGEDPIYISYTPCSGNYLPVYLEFSSIEYLPDNDNIMFRVYPNIVEIEFTPQKSVAYPPPLMPREIESKTFIVSGVEIQSTLIVYFGLWWIIETSMATLCVEYLGDVSQEYNVEMINEEPLLLYYNSKNFHALIYKDDEGYIIKSYEDCRCEKERGEIMFTSSNGIIPIDTHILYGEEITIQKSILLQENSSSYTIAYQFLTLLMIQNNAQAYTMLSSQLQEAFSVQEIIDYIGKFDLIDDAKYILEDVETVLCIHEKVSDNSYKVRAFVFKVDDGKINDIIQYY